VNPKIENRWIGLGTYKFNAGQTYSVVVDAAGADGNAHIDAVQILPAP
jgi:diketogulonate reductase-like aldo/keto reductase